MQVLTARKGSKSARAEARVPLDDEPRVLDQAGPRVWGPLDTNVRVMAAAGGATEARAACVTGRGRALYAAAMSVALRIAPAGIADLLAIPANERFHEIIDGELVRKAMPSIRHGGAQAGLTIQVGGQYNRRSGGRRPGGWRFATETEIRFEDDQIYRPDVAAWRRERLPEFPEIFPVTVRPDWVCEILSPSNESNDGIKKMRSYQRCGVPHYWIVDPIAESLIVYRWTEGGYLLVQSAQGTERVSAEPFDAVSFSVHGLLEGDDEDDA